MEGYQWKLTKYKENNSRELWIFIPKSEKKHLEIIILALEYLKWGNCCDNLTNLTRCYGHGEREYKSFLVNLLEGLACFSLYEWKSQLTVHNKLD